VLVGDLDPDDLLKGSEGERLCDGDEGDGEILNVHEDGLMAGSEAADLLLLVLLSWLWLRLWLLPPLLLFPPPIMEPNKFWKNPVPLWPLLVLLLSLYPGERGRGNPLGPLLFPGD